MAYAVLAVSTTLHISVDSLASARKVCCTVVPTHTVPAVEYCSSIRSLGRCINDRKPTAWCTDMVALSTMLTKAAPAACELLQQSEYTERGGETGRDCEDDLYSLERY
ncbi:hypothetical protein L7F22_036150 [Adiantum nelumboides]|nr:hypothetical protein [Adiantum nelumboides]